MSGFYGTDYDDDGNPVVDGEDLDGAQLLGELHDALTRYVVLPVAGGRRRGRAMDRGDARGTGVELRAAARRDQPGQAVRQEQAARHHRGDLPRPAADREHQPGRAGPLDRRRPADAAARRGRHRVRAEGRRQPRGPARHPERRALAQPALHPVGHAEPGSRSTARRSPWPRSPGSATCPTRSPTGPSSSRCAAARPARWSTGTATAATARRSSSWACASAHGSALTLDELRDAEPDMPVEDRAADTWEPLIAIADLAGGDWPARAAQAAHRAHRRGRHRHHARRPAAGRSPRRLRRRRRDARRDDPRPRCTRSTRRRGATTSAGR